MSDHDDPTRWAEDLDAPSGWRSDLRAARAARPSAADAASIKAAVTQASKPAVAAQSQPPTSGEAGRATAQTGVAAPPPTQAAWHLGAKFWLGVLVTSCAIAALVGRATRLDRSTSVLTDVPRTAAARPENASQLASARAEPTESTPSTPTTHVEPLELARDAGAIAAQRTAVSCDPRAHEREITDAHTRLASGDFSAVIAATDRDRDRCPRGAMSEDRERLAIEALLRSGQRARADARWAAFRRRFPQSLYARSLGVMFERSR